MTDKKSNESRRKLLKSIAAGSGAVIAGKSLPDNWSRPIVDSVVLPAHAATSNTFSGSSTSPISMLEPDSVLARSLDIFVPKAYAPISYKVSWCIIPISDSQANVTFLVHDTFLPAPNEAYLYQKTINKNVDTSLTPEQGCSNAAADAANWLNQFGLLPDAQADCGWDASLQVSDFTIGSPFSFEIECHGISVNESLMAGSTCPGKVVCD